MVNNALSYLLNNLCCQERPLQYFLVFVLPGWCWPLQKRWASNCINSFFIFLPPLPLKGLLLSIHEINNRYLSCLPNSPCARRDQRNWISPRALQIPSVAGELGKAGWLCRELVGIREVWILFCHRGVSTQPQCKVFTSWVKTSLGSESFLQIPCKFYSYFSVWRTA